MADSMVETYRKYHKQFLDMGVPFSTLMDAGYSVLMMGHLAETCDLRGVVRTYRETLNALQKIGTTEPGPPARPIVLQFTLELEAALFETMKRNCGCHDHRLQESEAATLSEKTLLEWRLLEQVSLDKEPGM